MAKERGASLPLAGFVVNLHCIGVKDMCMSLSIIEDRLAGRRASGKKSVVVEMIQV